MKLKILIPLFLIATTGCTVYRSPQRKEFESENPQFRNAQNLVKVECSHRSVRTKATSKRLVTVLQNSAYSANNSIESEFLWEYLIDDSSVFESDNLKGDYCVYENN